MARSQGIRFLDSAVVTYAVLPGHKLQLLHTLDLSCYPRSQDDLILSPDWRHAAFSVSTDSSTQCLAILRVPSVTESRGWRLPLCEPLRPHLLSGPSGVPEDNALRWQSGSTGVVFGSAGSAALLSFV